MALPLKDLLSTIIPANHRWKLELFKQWNSIIGPAMQKRVSIEKIDRDVLYIAVSHPAWAQELMLLTPILKEKINACFPEPKINHIRFHYASGYKNGVVAHNQKYRTIISKHYLEPTALTSQEQSLLEPLSDCELQSNVAAYLLRCKALNKER